MNNRFNALFVAAFALPVLLHAGCEAPQYTEAGRKPPRSVKSYEAPYQAFGEIERLDPALDDLLGDDAQLVKLAEGFEWSEGPAWVHDGQYLLFSDIPMNSIYRWKEGQGIRLFMKPSGYDGEAENIREPGSNGLAIDHDGQLVLCEHGNRRVARLVSLAQPQGPKIPVATTYEGKRLNSPNDLVLDRNGNIYFTDPPYGLPTQSEDDPTKQLDFQGVYLIRNPQSLFPLKLLTRELSRPNGIALSPDGRTLYVANSDPQRAIWMAYDVQGDGEIANGRVFADVTDRVGQLQGLPDGMAVDRRGNLWATGPGGVLIFSPEGDHLGTIHTGQATANCAFGADGSTLYITADSILAKIETRVKGLGF